MFIKKMQQRNILNTSIFQAKKSFKYINIQWKFIIKESNLTETSKRLHFVRVTVIAQDNTPFSAKDASGALIGLLLALRRS
jgi:hypothetical protein